jgi:hypothetical protein
MSTQTKPLMKRVQTPDQVYHCGLGVPVTEIFYVAAKDAQL